MATVIGATPLQVGRILMDGVILPQVGEMRDLGSGVIPPQVGGTLMDGVILPQVGVTMMVGQTARVVVGSN